MSDNIPNSPEQASDPDEFISVAEGAPSYGAIRVPLDSEMVPIPAGGFPTANPAGVLNYSEKTSFEALQDALDSYELLPLEEEVVVLHGGFVDNESYVVTLPVACGQIERVR